ALPPDRAGGHRGIRAQGHFAADNAFDALARSEHEHDIRALHADLEAETSAGEIDEDRTAPFAVVVTNHQRTLAAPTADAEAHFDHVRYDGDGIGAFKQPGRDVLFGDARQ